MKIAPQNKYVLCKEHSIIKNSTGPIVVDVDSFSTYQVIGVSPQVQPSQCSIGDVVVVNSTGTRIKDDNGESLFLFNVDNVMATIED